MIKLIVSDMDGTLLAKNTDISKGNLDAIQYAKSHGADFVIATGRDYDSIRKIMEKYDLKCMAIVGNGAQFVDIEGKILSSAYFPKRQFKEVIKVFDDLNIHYMVITANGGYSTHDPKIVKDAFIERCCVRFNESVDDIDSDLPCMHLKYIDNINEFLKSDINIIKIEAFSLNIKLIEKAKERLKYIDDIAYLSSFNDNVEVTDFYAQKGLILENVIQQLGIEKEEVMVLGDGFNDITMFQRFMYSFAPMNAEKGIKKLAYQIVKPCYEDGVAEAIYTMIPKGR